MADRVAPTTLDREASRSLTRTQAAFLTRGELLGARFDDGLSSDFYEADALSTELHGTDAMTVLVQFILTKALTGGGPSVLRETSNASENDENVMVCGGHSSGSMRWAAYTNAGAGGDIAPALSSWLPDLHQWYQMLWVYDGTQTGDANRIKLWYRETDADAWVQDTGLTFPNEPIPATLRSPTSL